MNVIGLVCLQLSKILLFFLLTFLLKHVKIFASIGLILIFLFEFLNNAKMVWSIYFDHFLSVLNVDSFLEVDFLRH